MSRAETAARPAAGTLKVPGLRWVMVSLVFLATVINYVDRQTVAVLKTSISDDLGLSNPEYAAIQNAFLIAYAASQMLSGRVYDAVGTRLGFTLSIIVWSVAGFVALVAGISRTAFAMAHERDLPTPLAAVHPTRRIPYVAEIVVAIAVIVAVLSGGLVAALSFSAFSVLLYYAVTNAAALRLTASERRWPRWLAWIGLVSCLLLAASLPWQTIALGVTALAIAMMSRAVVRIRTRRQPG